MRKLLCIATFVGMFCLGYCQDVKVNINNQDGNAKEECPYRINGICSTEDIGGVDVEFTDNNKGDVTWIKFTNYNQFPVTVLWSVEYVGSYSGCSDKTGTTVLGVNGNKEVFVNYCFPRYHSLNGIIVRKLAQ